MRFQSRPFVMPRELNRPIMLLCQPLKGEFDGFPRPNITPIQRTHSPVNAT